MYIRQIKDLLPEGIRHVLVCGDGEFQNWHGIEACLKAGYWYTFGNKRCKPVFPEHGWYSRKGMEYNECMHHPGGWKGPCRFVAVRIPLEETEASLFPETQYTYRIFVTNRTTRPHNVIAEYDKRADVENSVKEAQDEGIMAIPSKRFRANSTFFQIVMLAYNIWRGIKLVAARRQFPQHENMTTAELKTSTARKETIRMTRLKQLYIPAKLIFHDNRGKILYSTWDVRSAGLIGLLKYLDKRRAEPVCWPQVPAYNDTG
jgi:hypothetical protein